MIVIHCSEDGDHSVEQLTKEEFLSNLNDGCYGEKPEFANSKTDLSDLNCFTGYIVVDGDIVVPKPEKVVTKFKL
jgi:hypothetical protein